MVASTAINADSVDSTMLQRLSRAAKDVEDGRLHDEMVRHYMANQALWASGLLGQLHDKKAGYDDLNPAVLNSCQALAFVNASKGGFGVSLAHGYGFVIKKLSQDNYGASSWSQPLFFYVNQAGLGLSAGYQHVQSVIALLSHGSLDVFKHGTSSLGADLGLFSTDGALVGMSGGAALGHSQHLGMSVTNTRSAFCYSKVDGVYLELSLHGSAVSPDKESNEALYGKGYNADQILATPGPWSPEMAPLLKTINVMGKAAMTGAA